MWIEVHTKINEFIMSYLDSVKFSISFFTYSKEIDNR